MSIHQVNNNNNNNSNNDNLGGSVGDSADFKSKWREYLIKTVSAPKLSVKNVHYLAEHLTERLKFLLRSSSSMPAGFSLSHEIQFFCREFDDLFRKSRNDQLLTILYIIDGIFRNIQKTIKPYDLEMFARISSEFQNILEKNSKKIVDNLPELDCKHFIKLINLWIERSSFNIQFLMKWSYKISRDFDMMEVESSGSTLTPSPPFGSKKRGLSEVYDVDAFDSGESDKKIKLEFQLEFEQLPNEMIYSILSLLTVLDLIKVSRVSKYFYYIVNNWPFFKKVSFESSPNIYSVYMEGIFKGRNTITHLNLSYCHGVTNQVLTTIAESNNPLSHIKLAGVYIKNLNTLLLLLENHKSTIQSLNLSQISQLGQAFYDMIQEMPLLKSLNISCCHSLIFLMFQSRIPVSDSLRRLNVDCYCGSTDRNGYLLALNMFLKANRHSENLKKMNILDVSGFRATHIELVMSNIWRATVHQDMPTIESYLKTERKSTLNKRYLNGATALYEASNRGFIYTAKYLMKAGSDIRIPDSVGLTPLLISKDLTTALSFIEVLGKDALLSPTTSQSTFNVKNSINIERLEYLFIETILIIQSNMLFIQPFINQYPKNIKYRDLDILLEFTNSFPAANRCSHSIYQQSMILLSSILKNIEFLKSYIETAKTTYSRLTIINQTIRNDLYFESIPLRTGQQKSILLCLLEL